MIGFIIRFFGFSEPENVKNRDAFDLSLFDVSLERMKSHSPMHLVLAFFAVLLVGFFVVRFHPRPSLPVTSPLHLSSRLDVSFSSLPIVTSTVRVRALIVPHHLVGEQVIQQVFGQAVGLAQNEGRTIQRIVILSPNHFLRGQGSVQTTDRDWETKEGIVAHDDELTQQLLDRHFATLQPETLDREHGIFDQMPFIKHYFPSAKVVPLVFDESLDGVALTRLGTMLASRLGSDGLLIVSADFSHYLPHGVADFHDQTSEALLQNLDAKSAWFMDIDTPPSIQVLFAFVKALRAERFQLVAQANSTGDRYAWESTTSYVGGYYAMGASQPLSRLTFILGASPDLASAVSSAFDPVLYYKGVDFSLDDLIHCSPTSTFLVRTWSGVGCPFRITSPASCSDTFEKNGIQIAVVRVPTVEAIRAATSHADIVIALSSHESFDTQKMWARAGADIVAPFSSPLLSSVERVGSSLIFREVDSSQTLGFGAGLILEKQGKTVRVDYSLFPFERLSTGAIVFPSKASLSPIFPASDAVRL